MALSKKNTVDFCTKDFANLSRGEQKKKLCCAYVQGQRSATVFAASESETAVASFFVSTVHSLTVTPVEIPVAKNPSNTFSFRSSFVTTFPHFLHRFCVLLSCIQTTLDKVSVDHHYD